MATTSFRDLRVWQRAHEVALATYRLTRNFPGAEKYGITSQMRRAAVSIPANIAEGYGRRKPQDKIRFYAINEASAQELRYYLILVQDLKFVPNVNGLEGALDDVSKMLRKLIQAIDAADSP